MQDPRIQSLAELLVTHSIELQPGDRVLIHAFDLPEDALVQVVRACQQKGAEVIVRTEQTKVKRQMMLGMSESNARMIARSELAEMKEVNAYIAIRGTNNFAELNGVPEATQAMWQKEYAVPVVFETRVPHTKWVVLRWPTASMAQQASMATEAFETFFFDVCTIRRWHELASHSKPLWIKQTKSASCHLAQIYLSPSKESALCRA
jgi:aminopeptidase